MDLLGFVNSNGTLCTIIGSIITALISAIVAISIDNKKNKIDSIKSLKIELTETREKLEETRQKLSEAQKIIDNYTNIENVEKSVDKSHGAIYIETLPDGKTRSICGYCWENNRAKMPLMMSEYYDDDLCSYITRGYCFSCKANCYEA